MTATPQWQLLCIVGLRINFISLIIRKLQVCSLVEVGQFWLGKCLNKFYGNHSDRYKHNHEGDVNRLACRSKHFYLQINTCLTVTEGYRLVPEPYTSQKYEEICPPQVEELCYVTDGSYTKEEVHGSVH
ncbi:hypothetical protein HU200_004485 [Digitaria exilis]|uniref:Cyclin N-terminal domain-containing protein n=1 Tax=Digitaria exilis TaxID=1010633 RepID=A0A835FVT1_9POAL|nr:hypothetical protein HU200_004485 [Digitaria exilis]